MKQKSQQSDAIGRQGHASFDVFLSHATVDRKVANCVCEELELEGIRCLIAPRNIFPGEDWAKAIVDAVKSSVITVFVYSEAAQNSVDVLNEVVLASRYRSSRIVFRIANAFPSDALEYHFCAIQWMDRGQLKASSIVGRSLGLAVWSNEVRL